MCHWMPLFCSSTNSLVVTLETFSRPFKTRPGEGGVWGWGFIGHGPETGSHIHSKATGLGQVRHLGEGI